MSDLPTPSFLDYTPVALGFGTSGLRGLVRDITDLEAYVNVKGAIEHLLAIEDIRPGSAVVIGGDLRPSTERILAACAQAILDAGCALEHVGRVPTPALVLHAIANGRAGVMVTGSHIPFDRNGIKLSKRAGEVLKRDEPGILAAIARERRQEYGKSAATSAFDSAGMLRRPPRLPPASPAAAERYLKRYVGVWPRDTLRGLRIIFYQHSAVGRELVPGILAALGAEIVPAGRSDTFVPIDTENITDEQLARLQQLVDGAGGHVDAVVSTDGDSDRPLLTAVRDGRVQFLPGDLGGLVAAEYLGADAAAVPISANDAVERRLGQLGIELCKTKIGSPYVIDALDELQKGRAGRVVGWEANGGFLVGSDLALPGGPLAALPTRDAVLPIVANLASAVAHGVPLAALWAGLPARFGRAGLLDEFPVATSRALLQHLIVDDSVVVEFPDAAPRWHEVKAHLERVFTPALGFGAVTALNLLDGVRIWFANGDVAHLRPSGNAPQLRIYANADTQARADDIVALGVREPDGLLRQLEHSLSR
jgi:phosphomannomutase